MSHQNNVLKQKTSLFYIPMGKKDVSFRNRLSVVTQMQSQPCTQTFIDNNNTYEHRNAYETRYKEPPMMTYSTNLTRYRFSVHQFKSHHHTIHTVSVRTIIEGKSTKIHEESCLCTAMK